MVVVVIVVVVVVVVVVVIILIPWLDLGNLRKTLVVASSNPAQTKVALAVVRS